MIILLTKAKAAVTITPALTPALILPEAGMMGEGVGVVGVEVGTTVELPPVTFSTGANVTGAVDAVTGEEVTTPGYGAAVPAATGESVASGAMVVPVASGADVSATGATTGADVLLTGEDVTPVGN